MDGSAADVELKNNDVLYISSIHDLQDMGHITVSGEVARPGSYVFAANTTIEDAIIQAGGLLESASTAKIDVSRRIKNPTSSEVSDTLSYTFTYTIEDGFILGGDEFVLQPYDRIYVRKSPVYNVQNHVTISGEVVYPGIYALSHHESRLSDLIAESGGTTKWAYIKGAKLVRKMTAEERAIVEATLAALGNAKGAIEGLVDPAQSEYTVGINLEQALNNPGSDADVVLRDGDRLVVPEYTNTVKISGNVMYPNVVTYNPSMSVRKFVTMAGGYGYKAKKSKAYVVYMNGTVAKARGTSRKVVEPGCEIIVPTKIQDPTVLPTIMSIVSATSSTASMLSTMYALINSAVKK
jgi:protein involved in polysaccharide export with SLBB domain